MNIDLSSVSFDWNTDKNAILHEMFGIGFEQIATALAEERVLDFRKHPNVDKYPNQFQLVLEFENYAWVVPLVTDGSIMFLKTMYPSREATDVHLRRK